MVGCFVLAPWASFDALACMTGYARARPTLSTNSAPPKTPAASKWDKTGLEGQRQLARHLEQVREADQAGRLGDH